MDDVPPPCLVSSSCQVSQGNVCKSENGKRQKALFILICSIVWEVEGPCE